MKKIIIILSLIVLGFGFDAVAQNEMDALRYSQLVGFGGTARSIAMGGAFSALGADFSALSTNPGGIGVYKSSEFTITPSIYNGKIESSYNGTTSQESKNNFNISNAGMVYAFEANETGFTHIQFGFGINRTNNFHSRMLIGGDNTLNSMSDIFVNNANGTHYDDLNLFDTQLAFNTYMIDTAGSNSAYVSPVTGGVYQQRTSISKGSMNEFVISFGGNYEDKLYIGGTIGFPYIKYYEESSYLESDEGDSIANFKEFSYNQDLTTRGTGVNFKFGMIYRPIDMVRIGAAMHTPTWFSMHDTYQTWMESDMENGNVFDDSSPTGMFDYSLTTPWRAIGSLAFVIGKIGIISAEYEFVDYSEASLHTDFTGENFIEENQRIRNKYTSAGNIRVGAEVRVKKTFSIRGGFAYYGSPYDTFVDNDGSRMSYSGGFGFRQDAFFMDLAFVYSIADENYFLYDPDVISSWTATALEPVNNKLVNVNALMTVGFKF